MVSFGENALFTSIGPFSWPCGILLLVSYYSNALSELLSSTLFCLLAFCLSGCSLSGLSALSLRRCPPASVLCQLSSLSLGSHLTLVFPRKQTTLKTLSSPGPSQPPVLHFICSVLHCVHGISVLVRSRLKTMGSPMSLVSLHVRLLATYCWLLLFSEFVLFVWSMPWAASVSLPRLRLPCRKFLIMLHPCPQTFTRTEVIRKDDWMHCHF